MVSRIFRLSVACCLATTLIACGGKNNDNNGTNNDTNNDTTATNNGTVATNNGTTDPNNGTIGTNNGDLQCTQARQECVTGEETNDGFLCVDDVCRSECDPQAEPYDCLPGAVCLPVSESGPSYCQPSECDGYLDNDSCEAGLKCIEAVNDAAICIPAGAGAEGEACEEFGQCGAGLICSFGECNLICGADSACDEAGGERCLLGTLGANVGICEVGCDSYSTGQCPDGQGCYPITSDDGICDVTGTAGPYQACSATVECGENTACITFQGADAANGIPAVARCLPFCDASADTEAGRNSTCMSAGGSGDPVGYARFVNVAQGQATVDVYIDDVLVIDDLAFGATSAGFTSLDVGARTIDVVEGSAADNSAPLTTLMPSINANDALTFGVVPDATTTVSLLVVDEPRGETAPAAGSAKLRAIHAITDFAGNADIVAVPANALDFANEIVLGTDLALGSAGAFVNVPAGSYDVYIFPAGTTPRTVANVAGVTVTDFAVAAGDTFSVWARGTQALGDAAETGLTTVTYASAPSSSTGDSLSGFCLDLSQDGVPSPQSGFCLESCADSDLFGTDACAGPSDYCAALSFGSACFPGGPNGPGEACNPDNVLEGCDGTGYCEGRGNDTAFCRGYCQPTTQSNPLLGCEAAESCIDIGGNIGLCAQDCTPTNFADTSCPAGLQSCIPQERGGDAFCGASGDSAIGAVCDPTAATCVAGASCVNDFGQGNLAADDPFVDGACSTTCDLFGGDGSECGAGQVCAINWFTLNPAAGHCMTPQESLQKDQPCAAEFNVCGAASFCLDVGGGAQCLQMCDLDDATTCSAGTCTALFQSADIRIGACI